ncbi:substrate-binding domain-containing protein [Streptomyces acidiscabies]|uniref:substrate-binding domain-containing protein n=1 Tax=Streptomyces acidiscabies TaxID=42234 RepID=UPI0038F69154
MFGHPRIAALLVGGLLVAGCSSGSGGKKAEDSTGAGVPAGKAGTPRMKVALITHADPGDTFWDLIRKGASAAAQKDNVDLVYASDPVAGNQANLVQNAIDQRVDGIALTAAKPDAMRAVAAKAAAAGIPVVGFNSGLDAWKSLGMLEYFGQDETIAGQAFGKRLDELGAKSALCVVQSQGQVALESRCAGLEKGFGGKTEKIYVTGTDMPSVRATITAKLRQDPSIDQVVTLGAPFALTAVQSVKDAKSGAKVATFDLNKELVAAVRSGSVEFAVDQQPYLQGYLAVDALWLYRTNGNVSGGGTAPVLTGPAFVTKENVEAVSEFAEKGTR